MNINSTYPEKGAWQSYRGFVPDAPAAYAFLGRLGSVVLILRMSSVPCAGCVTSWSLCVLLFLRLNWVRARVSESTATLRTSSIAAFGKIWLGVNQLWTGGRVSAVWLALVLSGPASAPHCRRCLLLWLLVARGELCWLAFLVLWVFGSFPVHGMFQPGYGWGDVANPGLLG